MKFIERLNKITLYVAVAAFIIAMVIAVLNMLLRPFGFPVTGSFEILGYLSAIVTALGLGFSYGQGSHICVDIVFKRFSSKMKCVLSSVGKMACGLFFLLVSWKMASLALRFKENGELSETLRFPFYPITFIVALGIFLLALNLLCSLSPEGQSQKTHKDRN